MSIRIQQVVCGIQKPPCEHQILTHDGLLFGSSQEGAMREPSTGCQRNLLTTVRAKDEEVIVVII